MIELLRGDITTLSVDAIVNAANQALRGGGGVDGAIHRAAGPELLAELMHYPGCPTGGAVLTKGYRLPARYVIHTVGPIWYGGDRNEPVLLARAYESVFQLARQKPDIRSIAFPAISTGVYGFPKQQAATIAVRAFRDRESQFERIVACVFDQETHDIYNDLLTAS